MSEILLTGAMLETSARLRRNCIGVASMDSISSNSPQDNLDENSVYARVVRVLNESAQGICTKCGEKPCHSKSSTGWCKSCHNAYARENARKNYTPEKGRNNNLRKMYGITLEEYNLMLFQQGGVCAICKQPETVIHSKTKQVQPLAVDHNHETGEVRELLCKACNMLVGYVDIDRERVKQALKYLKKHDC